MAESIDDVQVRLVVAGFDSEGRSCVVSDANSPSRIITPAFAVVEEWKMASVPTPLAADNGFGDTVHIDPPEKGIVVRQFFIPPDHEVDESDFVTGLEEVGGNDHYVDATEVPGHKDAMHKDWYMDVLTVLAGELTCVLEADEVVLYPGDCFVQRGGPHAWANRGDVPAVGVCTTVAAKS